MLTVASSRIPSSVSLIFIEPMPISPVKVGLAIVAFNANAFVEAVDRGFSKSVVLSTAPKSTSPFTNDSPVLTAAASNNSIAPAFAVVLPKNFPVAISSSLLSPSVGILSTWNASVVIFPAAKLGISLAAKPSSKIFISAAVAVILKSLKSSTLSPRLEVKLVILLCAIEPASMAFVTPVALISNVLPVFVSPPPAVI